MTCVVCKHGETRPGLTQVVLERDQSTVIFKSVPAMVCENCGEAYIAEEITHHLLSMAEEAHRSGIQTEIRWYAEAS